MVMSSNCKSGIPLGNKDLGPSLEPIIKEHMLLLLYMILPRKKVLKMLKNSGLVKYIFSNCRFKNTLFLMFSFLYLVIS